MTIRATAVFDYRPEEFHSQEDIQTHLGWILPKANSLRAYWREHEPPLYRPGRKRSRIGQLRVQADFSWVLSSADEDWQRFLGPGNLAVWLRAFGINEVM